MNSFTSVRDAKEFLVSRIVEEAQRESVSLSEIERKMLYFSESGWTLPDIMDISQQFDLTYDIEEYEKKIANLIRRAAKRARKQEPSEYRTWWDAIRILKRGDHYITVLIVRSGIRPSGDLLKLWGTGFAVVIIFTIVFLFLASYRPDRYLPSKDSFWLFVWAVTISVAICYQLAWWVLGAQKAGDIQAKIIDKLFGVSRKKKEL